MSVANMQKTVFFYRGRIGEALKCAPASALKPEIIVEAELQVLAYFSHICFFPFLSACAPTLHFYSTEEKPFRFFSLLKMRNQLRTFLQLGLKVRDGDAVAESSKALLPHTEKIRNLPYPCLGNTKELPLSLF